MSQVTLESRILHLYTSDKKESGLVILLDKNGSQVGNVFDLKDPSSKKQLDLVFSHIYNSENPIFSLEGARRDQEREYFRAAKKISLATYYQKGFTQFGVNGQLLEISKNDSDIWGSLRKQSIEWVWGVKDCEIIIPSAKEIWEFFLDNNFQNSELEAVPGSIECLDSALSDFFKTNDHLIVRKVIDYSTAILIPYP